MYITVSEILLSISRSAHIQKQNMINELTSTSYNPCSNGILINMGLLKKNNRRKVLILVLMEYS